MITKTNFLRLALIVLIVLNLTTLSFIFFGRPPQRGHEEPREVVIRRLGFDEQQTATYDKLIEKHQAQIKNIEAEIRKNKDLLYGSLINDDSLYRDSLIGNIGRLQMELDETNCRHFLEVKKICRSDQMLYFNELTHDLARLFRPRDKKNNPAAGD